MCINNTSVLKIAFWNWNVRKYIFKSDEIKENTLLHANKDQSCLKANAITKLKFSIQLIATFDERHSMVANRVILNLRISFDIYSLNNNHIIEV